MAAVLQDFCGLKAGDSIILYLPMTAELPITMLACARLGIVYSVVFSGFRSQTCGLRTSDSDSNVLITMDAYYRNGKLLDHKKNADETAWSAKEDGQKIDKGLIWQQYPDKYNSKSEPLKSRDFLMNTLLKKYARSVIEPVALPAEDILFRMYTRGTTGRPNGGHEVSVDIFPM